ncbi:MAG: acetyl-CoA C-acyltransferase [Acidimicrobiales bacterium]
MSDRREAVIVDCVRTPIGRRKGALAGWHPSDLLASVLRAVVARTGVDPERVDDVIGGCVTQVGEQGCNVTRNAWVAAGYPQSVPATTVDRQCGSSQQAVHFAAQGVLAGSYDLVVACGVESMTRAPLASNAAGGQGPFSADFLAACDGQLMTQFQVASILADRWKITREDMDGYALESHRRAAAAIDGGAFAREVVPVGDVAVDEGIRRDTTSAALAALSELAPGITAGNSSQMSDGAAAMLIADREVAERLGLPVRGAIRHMVVAGDDAVLVLSAPIPATRKLLARTGLNVDDFDAIECNEAFAAVALMWAREFVPDMARYNPRGGAIALGHPLGASGVRLMTTLLHQLEDTGGRLGFQTMCEGGGQANATVIERLP